MNEFKKTFLAVAGLGIVSGICAECHLEIMSFVFGFLGLIMLMIGPLVFEN